MNLTNTALRNAKARPNAYKLTDGNGLYCLINQAGKYFRLDYRFQGKRKTLSLGVYPEVSLAEAREKATQARKLLKSGIDPSQYKQQLRSTDQNRQENAFETVAREWFLKYRQSWALSHADTVIARLEQNEGFALRHFLPGSAVNRGGGGMRGQALIARHGGKI